jgi:hypothetical protein
VGDFCDNLTILWDIWYLDCVYLLKETVMKLKKTIKSLSVISTLLAAAQVTARDLDIKLVNLTHSISFTPVLIGAHYQQTSLLHLGEVATASLQKMAEGGNASDLKADVIASGSLI